MSILEDTQVTRQQFSDLYLAAVGLTAPDPAYSGLLATSLADYQDPEERKALEQMSGCALVIRGCWKNGGVKHKILDAPYRPQHAISDLVEIARDLKALKGPGYAPMKGDAAIIGVGNNLHALGLVDNPYSETRSRDWYVSTVNGGQRDALGRETVLRLERPWTGLAIGGRPIVYVVDCVALALAERW